MDTMFIDHTAGTFLDDHDWYILSVKIGNTYQSFPSTWSTYEDANYEAQRLALALKHVTTEKSCVELYKMPPPDVRDMNVLFSYGMTKLKHSRTVNVYRLRRPPKEEDNTSYWEVAFETGGGFSQIAQFRFLAEASVWALRTADEPIHQTSGLQNIFIYRVEAPNATAN